MADELVRPGRETPLRHGNPSGSISSSQDGGDDAMEDGGATPSPEEDRGSTMEDVFGMSEEDILGDPEVEHAEEAEDAHGGLGFDMVAGAEEVQAEVVSEEGEEVVTRGLRPLQRVSKQERDGHWRAHLPHRDWCDTCVKASERRVAHRRGNKEERGQVPQVSMDYFYMSSKEEQDGNNPLVVMVDEETGYKYARMVWKKGLGRDGEMEWLVRDMSEELKSWGHVGGDSGRLIMKSDGEWSIKALKDALGRYHGGIIIPEVSARGESQSNGWRSSSES